jgi:hypothetical protein
VGTGFRVVTLAAVWRDLTAGVRPRHGPEEPLKSLRINQIRQWFASIGFGRAPARLLLMR